MYLQTITPDGTKLLIETENIDSIQLMQPVSLNNGNNQIYYMVIINYTDGSREQTVLTEDTWNYWNEEGKEKR